MPRANYVYVSDEPKVVCPSDPNYELPISIVDSMRLTQNDEELIQAMAQHRPRTKFKPGDLAYLTDIPFHIRTRNTVIPQVWKIRFIVTAWAYELMVVAMEHGGNIGMDHAISLLQRTKYDESQNRKPVIYAHGYPHGHYPNTAAWMPERTLKRLVFREPNAQWQQVVEEAGASFFGYDKERIATSFTFPMAPDDYSHGANIGRPFQHEEEVTHTACLSGLEEHLFVPLRVGGGKRPVLDAHHDVFSSSSEGGDAVP